MSIKEVLSHQKAISRIDLIAIISHVLSTTKERVLMEPERALNEAEWSRIRHLVRERRRGRPLAYLTNTREFFSVPFYVDDRVLIPRPETELLVEEALAAIAKEDRETRVLDMGTGSGVIGILLAKGGADSVWCVDISPGALSVALENARRLGVKEKVTFVCSDLFEAIKEAPAFDIVCANLPYVSSREWGRLMVDVRCHEPRQALVGGEKGTELYARLAEHITPHLNGGANIFCEIDGDTQAESVAMLLKKTGFNVAVKSDLAGRKRVVRGEWTSS